MGGGRVLVPPGDRGAGGDFGVGMGYEAVWCMLYVMCAVCCVLCVVCCVL